MKSTKQTPEVKAIAGKLKRHFGKTLENATREELYKASAMCIRDEVVDKWTAANAAVEKKGLKKVYYMSAEFLMGRAYINNLVNLGLLERYKTAFESLGLDIEEVASQERDAGLGNGGLGRLAACFLESLATLDLPAMGCGIRYEYGLFKQRIIDGEQVEMEDNWLEDGCVWEIERPDEEVEVHFGGEIVETWTDHKMKAEHKNYYTVMAVPYDMPVVGYKSKCPATLRLWSARAKDRFDLKSFNSGDYMQAMQEREAAEVISKVLYPDDSHEQGKQLRLKQFYFMTSATMQNLVRTHKERHGDLHSLPNYVAVQINDTHPTLAMPELMRILMDEENYTWEEAYNIVSRMFNYTNHTIMAEALECWEEGMFKALLPRIYSIVQELNQRYCEKLNRYYPGDMDRISDMAIVAYGQIRMANLCVAVARRVNGVSQLHGAILKNDLFADSYKIYPQKYLAITNGITHRRWLAVANPALTQLMTETIGDGFIKDYRQFDKLMEYTEDEAFLEKFAAVKQQNKQRLADYLLKKQGIEVNVNSIFDVQAKRLHEYKRQLLKCLHILYLYNSLQQNPDAVTTPITFFFAAKAAPGYARAKSIIRLINTIGELVNNDPATKGKLQVVFIENYEVSSAEVLIPATDISEQLSTAGLEASGTGNMKFMMNGAVTIGTMDGANVEIYDQVGPENIYIFGANVKEIKTMQTYKTYRPGEYFEKNLDVRAALDRLIDGTLPGVSAHRFSDLYQSLLFGDFDGADKYFVLHDLPSYIGKFARAYKKYCTDPKGWQKMAAINTAKSGVFSSDRTITEYNDKIWKLEKLK
ncbi:glycogen/starch/alpha-glucan phosphorylase [Bittarella sp. HCP28S3_D9]|uniref:glycogen/starch/alpha-glucan phosphorylase n=1 Tax=Bittarella sp. HCP28S3_D9 TaxID=3440253 RepID=UPI003F8B2CFB